MRFVLPTPSLQHIARVKIVSHLWNQRDIVTQITRAFSLAPVEDEGKRIERWMAIESEVQTKVSALPLPDLSKRQLSSLIKPIRSEIDKWCFCNYMEGYLLVKDVLPNHQLCWSMHGVVDYAKTAELLVKDESLDVPGRYEIACVNCLEDEARELNQSLRAERRRDCNDTLPNYAIGNTFYKRLIVYFTRTINGDKDEFDRVFNRDISAERWQFENALYKGSRLMCEYFFKKLNQREKEEVLEEYETSWFRDGRYDTRSLLYYLSLMNEEQQERMFPKLVIDDLLSRLLEWPMQSLFVEVATRGWQFMNRYDCYVVLFRIIRKMSDGSNDYDYSHLFRECWRLTSADSRQFCLHNVFFLHILIKTQEAGFIKLIVNEAPAHQILMLLVCDPSYTALLMDERLISDAVLMECKKLDLANSSTDAPDVEIL